MANKNTKYIEVEGQTLEVSVYYHLGGMNYFSSRSEPRGYYLSVTPVKVTKHDGGYVSKQYTAFSGTKICLVEAKRFSQSAFMEAQKLADAEEKKLIEHVMAKNKQV